MNIAEQSSKIRTLEASSSHDIEMVGKRENWIQGTGPGCNNPDETGWQEGSHCGD